MICPSCGLENEPSAKFCFSCGTRLPAAKKPPSESAAAPISDPPAAPEPEPTPPAAIPDAPAYVAPPPVVQPVYPAAPIVARRKASGALTTGGFLVLAGGVAAAASTFLPWVIVGQDLLKPDNWSTLWDWPPRTWDPASLSHPNGYYLLVIGIAAAVCGLILMSGLARARSARFLVALVAVACGVIAFAWQYQAFGSASSMVDVAGTFMGAQLTTMGFGTYVGIGGAIAIILGSMIALNGRD